MAVYWNPRPLAQQRGCVFRERCAVFGVAGSEVTENCIILYNDWSSLEESRYFRVALSILRDSSASNVNNITWRLTTNNLKSSIPDTYRCTWNESVRLDHDTLKLGKLIYGTDCHPFARLKDITQEQKRRSFLMRLTHKCPRYFHYYIRAPTTLFKLLDLNVELYVLDSRYKPLDCGLQVKLSDSLVTHVEQIEQMWYFCFTYF